MTAPESEPRTWYDALARGGALFVRDNLLNVGVLMSLIVGAAGIFEGEQPWQWLGPLLGVIGLVISFAAIRERIVKPGPGGSQAVRRSVRPSPAIWTTAVLVPVVDAALLMVILR